MAAIGQIRKHSGLLIAIVGVALAAFVLGDFLKPGNSNPRQYVGDIAGEEISTIDFQNKVNERVEATKNQRQGEKLSRQDEFQIRQSIWNEFVEDILLQQQLDKIGMTVSTDELSDQILGDLPHQYVKQAFTNPNTGAFDSDMLKNFLQNIDNADPDMKRRYLSLESMVKVERKKTKYKNLLSKGYYMPEQLAKLDFERKNATADISYVAAKFSTLSDSSVEVTQSDLQKYYNDHLYKYEQEETRAIDYVIFDVQPSPEDRKQIASVVNTLYKEFKELNDVDAFVNSVSDERYDSTFKKESDLPARIATDMFESPIGTMVGPYVENQTYYISKLINREERPDSLKMSQILVSYATAPAAAGISERTEEEADLLIDSLMKVLNKTPGKFEEIAAQFSDYPSAAEDKGEIGWVLDGNPGFSPFYNAGSLLESGSIDKMETALGYHIVKVSEKTDDVQKVIVATITRAIEPSNETFQEMYVKASIFAGENNTIEKFDTAVTNQGLNKRNADRLSMMANRLAGIESSRQIIRWAFSETTTLGKVSPVFEDEKKYVVAVLSQVREKGTAPLEEVKEQIRPLIANQKKAEVLEAQINEFGTTDLNQIASKLNTSVDSAVISFSSRNLPGFGSEYDLIGTIFTLEPGVSSGPIKGNNGVFVVVADKITKPEEPKDFKTNASQLERRFSSQISGNAYVNALKEQATIVDNRLIIY